MARSFPHRSINCLGLLLALFSSYGYGAGAVSQENSPFSPSTSLVVTPTTAQVRVGDTQLFSAIIGRPRPASPGRPNNSLEHSSVRLIYRTSRHVKWSVNLIPGGNATVGTIDRKGQYTAPALLPNPDSVTVTATSATEPFVSATVHVSLYNPVPIVTSISPTMVPVGNFMLTINGRKFVKGTQVLFAGRALKTTFHSASYLTAIGTATLAQVGNAQISINNPDPGSASSTTVLKVQAARSTISVSTSPSTTSAPGTSVPDVYGPALNADGLANLEVGKWGEKVGYRFRAEKSGPLQSILVFVKANAAGYFGGNGGQLFVELQADDGTEQHLPSGTVLAQSTVLAKLLPPSPFNRTLSFTTQPTLVQGTIYHLVFINPAIDSIDNYVSIDDLYNKAGTPSIQPGRSDVDLAVLFTDVSRPWSVDYFHTPILSLNFADGTSQGQGYIDTLLNSSPAVIGGRSEAREVFTVTGSNKVISKVSVRLRKLGSPGDLTVLLNTQDGSVIERGEISAATVNATYTWVTYTFHTNPSLIAGLSYELVLTAPPGNSYQICLLEKGVPYGFNSPTIFGDGHLETNTGSGWVDFQGRPDFDMQFFFTLADL